MKNGYSAAETLHFLKKGQFSFCCHGNSKKRTFSYQNLQELFFGGRDDSLVSYISNLGDIEFCLGSINFERSLYPLSDFRHALIMGCWKTWIA